MGKVTLMILPYNYDYICGPYCAFCLVSIKFTGGQYLNLKLPMPESI